VFLQRSSYPDRESAQHYKRLHRPGARRDVYRLPNHTWYAASGAKQPAYRKLADVAGQGIQATGGPDTPAGARLRDMESFFDYLDTEVPGVVERWHQLRERPAFEQG